MQLKLFECIISHITTTKPQNKQSKLTVLPYRHDYTKFSAEGLRKIK